LLVAGIIIDGFGELRDEENEAKRYRRASPAGSERGGEIRA
jgi:hypothetical protein